MSGRVDPPVLLLLRSVHKPHPISLTFCVDCPRYRYEVAEKQPQSRERRKGEGKLREFSLVPLRFAVQAAFFSSLLPGGGESGGGGGGDDMTLLRLDDTAQACYFSANVTLRACNKTSET